MALGDDELAAAADVVSRVARLTIWCYNLLKGSISTIQVDLAGAQEAASVPQG